jgi:hypothetical protein
MFREQFGTGDDAWLAECRQAHGLCRIELRVLECGQSCDAVHENRRELRSVDIDLISHHDLGRARKHPLDWWFLAAAGWQRGPGFILFFRGRKPHADDLSRSGGFGYDRRQFAAR